MDGAVWNLDAGRYRYGFNGKENDNEVKGEGNQQDYGFRIYDPRLGRFLSQDPLFKKFPELTPYQFSSNSPILNVDLDGEESIPYYIAKGIKGTITLSTFGSVSFGSVKSFSYGTGYDQYGNIAMLYSTTAGPSFSSNLSYDVGVKAAFLPGINSVSDLTGKGHSISASAGMLGSVSGGASLEFNSDEKLVGFGLQLSGGYGKLPGSWSLEVTNTTAVLFSQGEYDQFKSFVNNTDAVNVGRILDWNREASVGDDGQKLGSWTLGESVMSFQPVKGKEGVYEGVTTSTFIYRSQGSHKSSTGGTVVAKDVVTTIEDRSGIFFTKDGDNYKSKNFKQPKD